MSEVISIPRVDWLRFRKTIESIETSFVITDLVELDEAWKVAGENNKKTFQNKVSSGKYKVVSENAGGKKFFSRKQLLGLE